MAGAAAAAQAGRCLYCYQALDLSTLALTCGHQFHSRCCVQFLFKDKRCPTCLATVTAEGIVEAPPAATGTGQTPSSAAATPSPPPTASIPYPGAPVWTAHGGGNGHRPPASPPPAAMGGYPSGATPVATYTTPMGPTTEIVAVPTGNAALPYHYVARERCSWKAALALAIFMTAIVVIMAIPLFII